MMWNVGRRTWDGGHGSVDVGDALRDRRGSVLLVLLLSQVSHPYSVKSIS